MRISDFLPFILSKELFRQKTNYMMVQSTICIVAFLMYAVLLKLIPLGPIIYEDTSCYKCVIPPIHLYEVIPFLFYSISIVIGSSLSVPVYFIGKLLFSLTPEMWNLTGYGIINATFILLTFLIPILFSNIYFRSKLKK